MEDPKKFSPVKSMAPFPVATTLAPTCPSVTKYPACAGRTENPQATTVPRAASLKILQGLSKELVFRVFLIYGESWRSRSCRSPRQDLSNKRPALSTTNSRLISPNHFISSMTQSPASDGVIRLRGADF